MSRVLGVIPARIGSTRLPRKPLHPLLGVPLVAWVWHRARTMTVLDRVVVATDSPEVEAVCRDIGAEAIMTSPDHPSGSDRAWEVAERLDEPFQVVVNVQGDEPLMDGDHVSAAVELTARGFDVGTCATPISDLAEFEDPSVVKVVRAADGSALYFSRAPIPHRRDPSVDGVGQGDSLRLRHVGIYAYRREALERWVRFEPTRLEAEERLEQLRALEHGMRIGVVVVEDAARGVDTPADAAHMERRLRALGLGPGQLTAPASGP